LLPAAAAAAIAGQAIDRNHNVTTFPGAVVYAVNNFPVNHNAAAHARAQCDCHKAANPFAATGQGLPQGRAIGVIFQIYRAAQQRFQCAFGGHPVEMQIIGEFNSARRLVYRAGRAHAHAFQVAHAQASRSYSLLGCCSNFTKNFAGRAGRVCFAPAPANDMPRCVHNAHRNIGSTQIYANSGHFIHLRLQNCELPSFFILPQFCKKGKKNIGLPQKTPAAERFENSFWSRGLYLLLRFNADKRQCE
jgi:hypothetical protein